MTKKLKKLAKIIATLGISFALLLPLAACEAEGGHTHVDTDNNNVCDECGKPIGSTSDGNDDNGDDDTPKVPTGSVNITEWAGDLEACYAEWPEVTGGAKFYNVYVKPEDGSYTKIDNELVRKYPDHYRADAVGLAAGNYTMKVVPVGSDGNERENLAGTKDVTVEAHERTGFAFVKGTSSGAYNDDGTLKADARVIYITQNTKNTVALEVTGAEANPCVGLQAILNGYAKRKDSRPLCVRLVGNITDFAAMEKGDILVDKSTQGLTIEGIGSDATANGWGLRIKGSSNVEVRNLGFMNCDSNEGDDIGLQQDNDHVWVHNCDLFYGDAGSDADQVKGDGALDTKKSTYVTHSYNHFWDSGKSNLQGMKSESTENYITYHHNWYDHSDSRHPRIRTCTVHIYNNYFDGNAKYGVGVTYGASAFVENNYFRSTAEMKPMLSSKQGTDAKGEGTFSGEDGGIIKSYGNKFVGSYKLITQKNATATNDIDCYEVSSRDEQVPDSVKTIQGGTAYNNFDTNSSLMYEYEVDTPDEAKTKVEKWAGRVGGGDLQYEFNNAKEDSNYAVIQELKDMLVNYSSTLLEIGGVKVEEVGGSTGGTDGDSDSTGGGSSDDPIDLTDIDVIIFNNGPKDSLGDGISNITVVGSYSSSSSATFTFNGVEYKNPLKMETGTSVTIKFEQSVTLTIHTSVSGKKIKVNGTNQTTDSNGVVTITVNAGECVIEKGDSMNLCYILLELAE